MVPPFAVEEALHLGTGCTMHTAQMLGLNIFTVCARIIPYLEFSFLTMPIYCINRKGEQMK